MFTFLAAGKTNRKGLRNPLLLAVSARAHFDTVRLPFPPAFLQRAALAFGAPRQGARPPEDGGAEAIARRRHAYPCEAKALRVDRRARILHRRRSHHAMVAV
jgi:hypothetical protein